MGIYEDRKPVWVAFCDDCKERYSDSITRTSRANLAWFMLARYPKDCLPNGKYRCIDCRLIPTFLHSLHVAHHPRKRLGGAPGKVKP